ncbi:MAG: hypothetical protein HY221_00520 [Candidatus Sungbacteria bacterium]|uniref:DUF4015 domain-containing protein n=1 Tax=Candidatus Sungiibacteriota bacterium TaxID=2750080 RepID=A0A932VRL1_9BACT|nr:hypothetical protein [Candidatus Sungbacteria bacterium]
MKTFAKGFGAVVALGAILVGLAFAWSMFRIRGQADVTSAVGPAVRQKTKEELIAEARERSSRINALYMTADVANDPGMGAAALREKIIGLAQASEINGIVIDVKEVCGPDYNEVRLKDLLRELHQKNIWAIARIVSFKDASQRQAHPEWYLTRRSGREVSDGCAAKHHLVLNGHAGDPQPIFWRDNKGGYWMDPASQGARQYLAGIAEKMIDLGFDELQFDYVRFPSDGDVSAALYPVWDKTTPRYAVMEDFFRFLNHTLKEYRPEIILSADLFGYVAVQHEDETIGQRLEDIGDSFDYVSFMVYPSHYYAGLFLLADPSRNLTAVNYSFAQARANPGVVVERSLYVAHDFLNELVASSTATTTPPMPRSSARLRPWLEDFFHEADRLSGRPYGTEKVRMQIDAAERVERHGWMLWNASNIYTSGALKKKNAASAEK